MRARRADCSSWHDVFSYVAFCTCSVLCILWFGLCAVGLGLFVPHPWQTPLGVASPWKNRSWSLPKVYIDAMYTEGVALLTVGLPSFHV